MEAYSANRLGGLDALIRSEVGTPEPGAGQIRIAVRAAGLHLADLAALAGQRPPRPSLPFIPGFEVSGTVDAVGPDAGDFAPGQAVIAFVGAGGLGELVLAEAALCVPMPEGVAFGRAAGLPIAYAGALVALRDRARLEAGQRLLVLGAGGQAGLAAIDLGQRLGAEVIAVAGQESRLEAARAQGADHTIAAAAAPLGEAVLALTDGRGADVVFDPVGGEASRAAMTALAPGGRIVCAGFAAGEPTPVNVMALYGRDAAFIAANVAVLIERAPDRARRALAEVAEWTAGGAIRPRIAAQFPFDEAHHALDYVMNRRDAGAVVVTRGGKV